MAKRWARALTAGLLSGLLAALVMTALMLLLRSVWGVPAPAELVGERIVPGLTIEQFFSLFERVGGYNNLKKLGVGGVIGGQLVFGIMAGLLYALVVERGRGRAPDRLRRWGISRGGRIVAAALAGLAFVVSVVLLWPTLDANFRGLPPSTARAVTIGCLLLDYASFSLTLVFAYRLLTGRRPLRQPAPIGGELVGRRAVLAVGAAVLVAAVAGEALRRLYRAATFAYDGTRYQGPDIQPITPNERFYSVTKNVVDPEVWRGAWRLEIGGSVEQPRTLSFADLEALPAVQQETTLMCISNSVGDGLQSNAVWTGVPLASLLQAARPRGNIVEARLTGADGYVDTFPLAKALEPTTLVVYAINGQPLPRRNGYPVRVIVPGMYGEKNVKWVTRIELIDYDAKGFYESQGWGPNFVVPINARFHGPNIDNPLPVGQPVPIFGTAFAGNQGVSRVEVSVDGGSSWNDARITYPGTMESWVHWLYDWTPPSAGEYGWVVRAYDSSGNQQTADERGITPQGATGYHKLTVRVG